MKTGQMLALLLRDPGLFRYHLQRSILSPTKRRWISGAIARVVGRRRFPGPSLLPPDVVEAAARGLGTSGYARLGRVLSAGDVASVRAAIEDKPCYDGYEPALGRQLFPLADAPPACANANFRWQDVVALPQLMRVANDPGILAAVQEFLGGAPTISDIAMWWSIVRDGTGKDSQLFHRDVDEFRFCKLFIYLTDVGPDGGPHVYVQGSASSWKCLPIQRYTDEQVEAAFGPGQTVTFCEPAGSAFLVNTYGVHKGLAPTGKPRLIFVVQYSLLPVGLEKHEPVRWHWPAAAGLDPYVNRLYLQA
jgi:hypothetical protein